MKQLFKPLVVFVSSNIVLLVVLLLMPAIGNAGDTLQAETAEMASTFWGWSWASGSVRLLVWLVFEAIILWATGKAFINARLKQS